MGPNGKSNTSDS